MTKLEIMSGFQRLRRDRSRREEDVVIKGNVGNPCVREIFYILTMSLTVSFSVVTLSFGFVRC